MSATQIPPRLQIHVLGEMQVAFDGAPLAGKHYGKVLALLAYLVVEADRHHRREALAELLWPTLPAKAARTNLRQALHYLRRALGGDDAAGFLVTNRASVGFSAASPHWLDLSEFTEPAPACPDCGTHCETEANADSAPCAACLDEMERRANLYRGAFLAGLAVDDAPGYEDWRAAKGESLHREALALLERLRLGHERRGASERALLHARRFTKLEPWDEEGHRGLMRLLAESGQRGAALAQYEACRAILSRELDLEPETRTRELAEHIRTGSLEAPRPSAARAVSSAVPIAERRQATVLCCSLDLPGGDDPDTAAERLAEPLRRCAEIARDHGAHVAQPHGGVLLAYFGYPAAFEGAAVRAVRAALELTREIGARASLHVGIHTGIIVTGEDPALPDMALPDTAGVASKVAWRLCDRSAPGDVVISDSTRRLVEGHFRLRDFEPLALGGSSPTIRAYRVAGETGAVTRLDAAPRWSALTGRRTELARLLALWEESEHGGRLVLIRGDAGLGKSRLIRALGDRLSETPCAIEPLHCFPEYRQSPLRPVVALLESRSGMAPEDSPETRLGKLTAYLAEYHPARCDQATPVLAPLIESALADAPARPPASHEHVPAVVRDLLEDIAADQPLLLVVEDLHWADPSTLDLLEQLARRPMAAPILTVLSARAEFEADWLGPESILELAPLADSDIARLAEGIAASLPADTVRRIVARADGVPLFAEEMALMADDPSAGAGDIPATLHDLLLARLDALPEARRTAQLAATVGREFDRELLGRIDALKSADVDAALRSLQEARLIAATHESGAGLQFRHALIQEAAYQAQTRSDRQVAHQRVAEALIAHFPRRAAQEPDQVARHLTDAGATAEAIPWWLAAGRRALRTSANAEATDHLRAGLARVEELSAGSERDARELELLLPLGQATLALYGYGSREAAAIYDRANALCGNEAPESQRFEALWGSWMVSSSREDCSFSVSGELARALLSSAQACDDRTLLTYAHSANANIALWRGELETACRFAESAIADSSALYGSDPLDGHDPRVASLAHLSWGRFCQGRDREALEASQRSIALATEIDHPDSLGFALVYAAMLQRFMRNAPLARDYAQQALAVAEEYRLPLWQGGSTLVLGWVQAFDGDTRGTDVLTACASGMRNVMPGVLVAFLHALAEAHGFLGEYTRQLGTVDEALRTAARVDEHFHKADLYRLRGESLANLYRHEEARTAFQEAVRIADAQGAHAIRDRASNALAAALHGES